MINPCRVRGVGVQIARRYVMVLGHQSSCAAGRKNDSACDKEWQDRVKGLLKAESKRQNVSYRELADKLTAMGVAESESNIKNKISRGGFTAVFFVQCLSAIGCTTLRLEDA